MLVPYAGLNVEFEWRGRDGAVGEIAVWTGAIHVHIAEGHVVENAAVAYRVAIRGVASSAAAGPNSVAASW